MADTNWYGQLGSAVIGGLFGFGVSLLTAKMQFKSLIKLEQEKKNNTKEEQRMKAYNSILKADGEAQTYRVFSSAPYDPEWFDFKEYETKVRSQIYENLHLLEIEMIETVQELDRVMKDVRDGREWGVEPFGNSKENSQAFQLYNKLIDLVRQHYK